METIQDFAGVQFPFSDDPIKRKLYNDNNWQYATSTHQIDHDMFPGLIAVPRGDDDIIKAIKYAGDNDYPVAVMSGGHQYSGACSTHGKGIQLNLRQTYKNPATDLVVLGPIKNPADPSDTRVLVRASVSWSLGEFNAFMTKNELFVPHGQCTDVRLGGHVQTGGYGQLARAFGLIGDHIVAIRMINHKAEVLEEVTADTDKDLFDAILGGSPGNFGIITHWTIAAHRDQDYDFGASSEDGEAIPANNGPRPHGYKGIWLYSEYIVKKLLNEVAAMASDPDFPRNFDLCVSVLSSSFPMIKLLPELEGNLTQVVEHIGDLIGVNADTKWPASVVLYAQWVPLSANDKFDAKAKAFFQKFKDLEGRIKDWYLWSWEFDIPMSEMTGKWLFTRYREFDYPYVKRTYMTNSTTLVQDKWVDQVADQINKVMNIFGGRLDLWEHCYLSCQIQVYGGKHSQFRVNAQNGTSYSWRDSTVCQVLDCFHTDSVEGKKLAEGWQADNDSIMAKCYSKQDRRVLWGSYGEYDLDKAWPFYYETREKYEKIGKQRGLADPKGTFTPNPFAVKAIPPAQNGN